jgi:hypothetical protein
MKTIAAAFVKAQREFGPALKTHTNPAFRSKYADLSACVEAVIDALNANGIALMQHSHECVDGVLVETLFLHESGETLSAGKLHVPAAKKDAQGYGSALTYARRYSLMAACGIAPEDDDGNAASKKNAPIIVPVQPEALPADRAAIVEAVRSAIVDHISNDDIVGAYEEAHGLTDSDEKMALWKMLPSNVRSAIKKHGDSLKQEAGTARG